MSSEDYKIRRILDFWFGDLNEKGLPSDAHRRIWWIKDPENDEMIKVNFGNDLNMAIKGELENWSSNHRGSLALILLLDQFSRNIYRDTAKAFSQDQIAVKLCLEGIDKSFDNKLHPVQRIFYYMPLMHSEDICNQEKSIKSFSNLAKQSTATEAIANMVFSSFEYALKHYEIVKRFGRYPHRNKILGRESTQEEIEFLSGSGSSF